MNIPNFKGIISKLSIFRNNLSLLVSIILTVIALVLFVPTRLFSGRLRDQIQQQSIGQAQKIKRMDHISAKQWEVEKEYQQAYANDANQIARLIEESTKRELLSYKIFPEPKDRSALIFEEFGKRFRTGVEGLVAGMNSCECPTQAELEKALERSTARSRTDRRTETATRSLGVGSMTESYRDLYGGGAYGMISQIDSTIVEEVCLDKAKSGRVYTLPTDISGYEFWGTYEYKGVDEAVKDCWYWQLGYWIIEDIIATIDACNSGSQSVLTSPVKRLMGANFTLTVRAVGTSRYRRGTRTRERGDDKPAYVLSAYDGLVSPPCTGRYSNDEIDVMHFDVTVVVSADAVLSFMKELCSAKEHKFSGFFGQQPQETFMHNQISILESSVKAVDRENLLHRLYRYGDDAVVELDLICEYIFNKASYEEIKPKAVIEALEEEKSD